MKRALIASLVFGLLSFIECNADIAIMAGLGQFILTSDASTYPIANSLFIGESFAKSIAMCPSG